MSKNSYMVKTTSGSEAEYTYKEIFDTVKQIHFKQFGRYLTDAETDKLIPEFLVRYKLVDTDENGNVLTREDMQHKDGFYKRQEEEAKPESGTEAAANEAVE